MEQLLFKLTKYDNGKVILTVAYQMEADYAKWYARMKREATGDDYRAEPMTAIDWLQVAAEKLAQRYLR